MTGRAEDPPPEAGKLPTSRLGRTARVGGLVTGQGVRWAGMRAANRLRTPERAEAAQQERTAALVNELVDQLSRMRGAAMKVGQMISMVEFDGLPEDQRQALQTKLASLRDSVPPVPFPKLERMMRDELGGPLTQRVLGVRGAGVRRRVDRPGPPRGHGRAATGGGQGPVPGRRRGGRDGSAQRACCCCRWSSDSLPDSTRGRCSPSSANGSARSSTTSSRPSTSAASSGRCGATRSSSCRASTPPCRPGASWCPSTSRGDGFEAVRERDEAERDRYAEIVFRFYFGLAYRDRIALGDPHPGNYLLRPDGRVAFLDYGLLGDVGAERVNAERAIAQRRPRQGRARRSKRR